MFKNVSSVIVGYGKVIWEARGNHEVFKKYEMQIRKEVSIVNCLLGGGYTSLRGLRGLQRHLFLLISANDPKHNRLNPFIGNNGSLNLDLYKAAGWPLRFY